MSKLLEKIPELLGWLQIAAAPTITGAIAGVLIYLSNPSTFRLILAIAVAIICLILGIYLAKRIYKKKGTVDFLSKINEMPEMDKEEELRK